MHIDMDQIYANIGLETREPARGDGRVRVKRSVLVVLSTLLFLFLLAIGLLAYLYKPSGRLSTVPLGDDTPSRNCSDEVSTWSSEQQFQDRDSFYIFSKDKMNWTSSRKHCQELGGDLLIINSKEEQKFVTDKVVAIGDSAYHWIGLTDAHTEGVWYWVDQTPLMDQLSWWEMPPDDWKAADPLGEDCVIHKIQGWGDVSCIYKERRICEFPCIH